jgi:hypothetical protein
MENSDVLQILNATATFYILHDVLAGDELEMYIVVEVENHSQKIKFRNRGNPLNVTSLSENHATLSKKKFYKYSKSKNEKINRK